MAHSEPEPEPKSDGSTVASSSSPEVAIKTSNGTSWPENSGSAEPKADIEPVPEWSSAIKTWGASWDFHLYGLGSMFALLAALSLASAIIVIQRTRGSRQAKVSTLLLVLLTGYGTFRSLYLCIDAYNHKRILPKVALNLIWGIAQPCLITAYTLLFVVIRNALRLKQRFQSWFTTRNILIVVIPHFMIVFFAEISISFSPSFKAVTFTCQLLYTLLSSALAVFYAYISVVIKTKVMNGTSTSSTTSNRMGRVFNACIAVAIGGIAIAGVQVYDMTCYSVYSHAQYAEAWPWYSVNTALRLLELYLAVMLLIFARHQSGSGDVRRIQVAKAFTKTSSL